MDIINLIVTIQIGTIILQKVIQTLTLIQGEPEQETILPKVIIMDLGKQSIKDLEVVNIISIAMAIKPMFRKEVAIDLS